MAAAASEHTLTSALEDYLETAYRLVCEHNYARVKDIAKARNVKAGSVTPALKRLSDLGLINYERREYVTLTPAGEREARRVFARHRLLTRFFKDVLQMSPKAAEEDACSIEHNLSDEAMNGLVRFFEFVGACQEGGPNLLDRFRNCPKVQDDVDICPSDCKAGALRHGVKEEKTMTLYDLKPGEGGEVVQIHARGAIRQRLLDMGILPQSKIEVERIAPTGDPVWIKLLGMQLALRRKEAEGVLITPA